MSYALNDKSPIAQAGFVKTAAARVIFHAIDRETDQRRKKTQVKRATAAPEKKKFNINDACSPSHMCCDSHVPKAPGDSPLMCRTM
jgi:hypothetical protein